MNAEWVSAISSIGTLVVIAATAMAALIQLKHIRAANQLAGLLNFTAAFESDDIQSANRFIGHELPQKLNDPAFVRGLLEINTDRREHPELRVCDFMEQQGSYIKYGMIDKAQYLDLVGAYVTSMWEALREIVAIRRHVRNSGRMYENFEYLASISAGRDGPRPFPHGVRILMPEAEWREIAQRRLEASGGGTNVS